MEAYFQIYELFSISAVFACHMADFGHISLTTNKNVVMYKLVKSFFPFVFPSLF